MLRPAAVGEPQFEVRPRGDGFLVRGEKPERWVRQTDFTNAEAVGYLADRLARLGVEQELARLGAQAGTEVSIGEVSFDWEPTLQAGAGELALGPRGTDLRLAEGGRSTRAQRQAAGRDPGPDADPSGEQQGS